MIAEINNKAKKETLDSEDELTGNFFGNLRYLPFDKGLKYILSSTIYPKELEKVLDRIDADEWSENIEFWRSIDDSEPDVLLTFENTAILIEVKYNSYLSSPDQLVKYGKLLDDLPGEKEKLMILLAREGDARRIYEENIVDERLCQLSSVSFGFISWQNIFDALQSLMKTDSLNQFERVVICDLIDLLGQKGFEKFRRFDIGNLTVDSNDKWEFDCSTVDSGDFSFLIEQNVERGFYYEFR